MLITCPCLALRRSRIDARVIHIKPSTSMRPNLFDTSPTKDSMLSLSATSSSSERPSSPATRLRRSRRRAPPTTWKPHRPSSPAVAAPMPDEAPVMTATGVDLFVPLPPYAAYPRENAAGGPRRVHRRPSRPGRRRCDDGPQPDGIHSPPPLIAAARQGAFSVPDTSARGLDARLEREDPARSRGGGTPVHPAACSR